MQALTLDETRSFFSASFAFGPERAIIDRTSQDGSSQSRSTIVPRC